MSLLAFQIKIEAAINTLLGEFHGLQVGGQENDRTSRLQSRTPIVNKSQIDRHQFHLSAGVLGMFTYLSERGNPTPPSRSRTSKNKVYVYSMPDGRFANARCPY